MNDDLTFQANRPAWASNIRTRIVSYVGRHSKSLAAHQAKVKQQWLDVYFKYSSVLGTHTFFMLFLPVVYQSGGQSAGRILILTSALAVCLTAYVKDFFCVPRPFSPPVQRLIIGTHHLEYGFPSTHSANSVGMTIFFYRMVQMTRSYAQTLLSDHHPVFVYYFVSTYLVEAFLVLYTFTIVYGRLYVGMHSVLDCIVGCIIGAIAAAVAIVIDPFLDDFLHSGDLHVPLTIFAASCVVLAIHVPPVDACPCFEDAVAFVGAWTGVALGNWRTNNYYYADLARLNSVFNGLGDLLPSTIRIQCQQIWSLALSNILVKFFVNLTLGVVPIVLFKELASQPIKSGFCAIYLAMINSIRGGRARKQEDIPPVPNSEPGADTAALRRRKIPTSPNIPGKSEQGAKVEPWDIVDEKVCLDGPRLLIYVAIGILGTWASVLLIDYLDLKLFKLVYVIEHHDF